MVAAGALAAVDDADDAGLAEARHHVVAAEFLQLLGDEGGGLEDVEIQFWRLVQMASPAGDFILHFGGAVQNRHNGSISLLEQTVRPAASQL